MYVKFYFIKSLRVRDKALTHKIYKNIGALSNWSCCRRICVQEFNQNIALSERIPKPNRDNLIIRK